MTNATYECANDRRQTYARERRAYQVAFAVAYPIVLVSALVSRLNPFPSRSARGSLLAETRASAEAIVPFIFMG